MTKDGFTLLAKGFKGAKALQFKLDYIKAFNEMEQQLKEIEDTVDEKGSISFEEYYEINFKAAQRVRKAFLTNENVADTYDKFVCYSKKKLDVPTRIKRLHQIISALTDREDNLFAQKKQGYRAEREVIIELKERILRDIDNINNRSYGVRLGKALKVTKCKDS